MMNRIEKHTALLLLTLATMCSCEKDPREQQLAGGKTIHYSATVESGIETRATMNGGNQYVFEEGDRLYVESTDADAGNLYGILTLVSGANERTATFEGDLTCVDEFIPVSTTPLSATLIGRYERGVHSFTDGKLNSARTYRNEYATDLADAVSKYSDFVSTGSPTFGDHSFTLAQQSTFLVFAVKFSSTAVPDGTNVLVKVFNGGETPLRSANVRAVTVSNTRTRVRFVAAFPGGTTSLSGAELSVKWGDGQEDHEEFEIANKNLLANNYYSISRSTLEEYRGFRIKATVDDTSITLPDKFRNGGNEGVQYSIDEGDTWPTYTGQTILLNAGEEVWLKGTMADCYCSGDTQLFNADHLCYIAGDITSLLGYPANLPANAFRSAFSTYGTNNPNNPSAATLGTNFTAVTWVDIDPDDPLILPASTAANCYLEMFMGCTSLTHAPDLPATTLADKCYFRMFHSCTSLTAIPTFPLTAVTWSGTNRYCYQMFQSAGITKLTDPLPVNNNSSVATGCFEDMFAHCTALDSVVVNLLPATTLATNCYRGMFQDTRFKRAPDLLAGTLVSECYRYMFNACSNLKYIKCLATAPINNNKVGGNGYTTNWVGSVNALGTFVKDDNTTWSVNTSTTSNTHGTPKDWTVKTLSEEQQEQQQQP